MFGLTQPLISTLCLHHCVLFHFFALTHLLLQAYTPHCFRNRTHFFEREYPTYTMGSNRKWEKKAHNQVWRYPLRLRRGSGFVVWWLQMLLLFSALWSQTWYRWKCVCVCVGWYFLRKISASSQAYRTTTRIARKSHTSVISKRENCRGFIVEKFFLRNGI